MGGKPLLTTDSARRRLHADKDTFSSACLVARGVRLRLQVQPQCKGLSCGAGQGQGPQRGPAFLVKEGAWSSFRFCFGIGALTGSTRAFLDKVRNMGGSATCLSRSPRARRWLSNRLCSFVSAGWNPFGVDLRSRLDSGIYDLKLPSWVIASSPFPRRPWPHRREDSSFGPLCKSLFYRFFPHSVPRFRSGSLLRHLPPFLPFSL